MTVRKCESCEKTAIEGVIMALPVDGGVRHLCLDCIDVQGPNEDVPMIPSGTFGAISWEEAVG